MKRILKTFIASIACVALLATCSDDEDKLFSTMTSTVDLSGSTIADDQAHTSLLFSTDGGTTWANYMTIKAGGKYKVRILNRTSETVLMSTDFYSFDWSQSSPKPSDATSDTPEFTLQSGDNKLHVVVIDTHCAYDGPSWTGNWIGVEGTLKHNGVAVGTGSNDAIPIIVDGSTTNGFIMDNFFGDGTGETVTFVMTPSTSAFDQNLTIPEQLSGLTGATTSGSGTYDQCRETMTMDVNMEFGPGDLWQWTYQFHRP